MRNVHRFLSAFTLASILVACGGETVKTSRLDDGAHPLTALTELNINCPPIMTGNDQGVGTNCTPGGGECEGTGAPYCTGDLAADAPYSFCTKACIIDGQCGEAASCLTHPDKPTVRGCIPDACIQ